MALTSLGANSSMRLIWIKPDAAPGGIVYP